MFLPLTEVTDSDKSVGSRRMNPNDGNVESEVPGRQLIGFSRDQKA